MGNPKNIIVRMPNWLGDAVMATPILHDLRQKFKDAKITAMATHPLAPLLKHNPYIDEIFSFKRPSGWIHRKQHLDLYSSIRRGEYDLGILLPNSFSSAWWFFRGGVKKRIGFATHGRSLLLTTKVPLPKNIETEHLVLTYKEILEPLGIPRSTTAPELFVSEDEKRDAKTLLKNLGIDFSRDRIIGINPGAAFGSAKCWLPDRFQKLTTELLERPHFKILYFGDQNGAPLVKQIVEGFDERVINLAGKTNMRELMALIQTCNLFLTNDSGPMHIADALRVPLVALFGSTSDVKTGPYHKGCVIHKHVDCSPCYKRVCPIDFRCMKRIEVEEVKEALLTEMEKTS